MGAGEALRTAVESGLAYALEPRLAPHYERHLVDECHYRTPEILACELAALRPTPGLFVDAGAGSGLVGKTLLSRGIAISLVAVDISRAMLELIDSPAYIAKHVVDCTRTPFDDTSFDGALAAGLLEHIVDPDAFFLEIARVVRPGGSSCFHFLPIVLGERSSSMPTKGWFRTTSNESDEASNGQA